MKPHVEVRLTAGTLCAMTDEQFHALRDNILAEGRWDTEDGPVNVMGGSYLGVTLQGMFIGIEPDGYTHT